MSRFCPELQMVLPDEREVAVDKSAADLPGQRVRLDPAAQRPTEFSKGTFRMLASPRSMVFPPVAMASTGEGRAIRYPRTSNRV